ncbi:TPA: glycoside hydrolase family 9 protein [Aeromonas salmonicida]|uniref:glycoside hydrolase family 9 protein n=1 Tax=Aeromonas salmonicida TaxID=645 RepID=UPI00044FCA51|nr:glycoside hydrolase family 9 protein [Aeromonas salmonicida]ASI22708.1 chitobiase [Aeromonas salmonicida]ASI27024.1 chitobiase [Aeromonas salmonicida]ASI31142.1 chitobiase [Aeromonas salmonicida]ATD39805.1 chitobiase [Aeromonas salmonicida subsp. masoucida]ELI6405626.1 glycoside hydrolase family 9 protein [Aeromonas salmonicida subsp. salmonicida]
MELLINQVGYECDGHKVALLQTSPAHDLGGYVRLQRLSDGQTLFETQLQAAGEVPGWQGRAYWRADFSAFKEPGHYRLEAITAPTGAATTEQRIVRSTRFTIGQDLLASRCLSDVIHYFKGQRASGAFDRADRTARLFGTDQRKDVHGGWFDASGDMSKYLSHLSYANYLNPQQTPMVVWALLKCRELLAPRRDIDGVNLCKRLNDEAQHGADFLCRMQDESGFFFMTLFDKWSKDPAQRELCAYATQQGIKSANWQAGFRQGGGMAIAALARAARESVSGDVDASRYAEAARRGYLHLREHNLAYLDDGVENIIDDYCALLAAVELTRTLGTEWLAEARDKAGKLCARQRIHPELGHYWSANEDGSRPYYHAAEAGLPVLALLEYLGVEPDQGRRAQVQTVVQQALAAELALCTQAGNPFSLARQYVKGVDEAPRVSFFMPHPNESGYWWQGENARLASLAAMAFAAAEQLPQQSGPLLGFGQHQLDWILGQNPFNACMLAGHGINNPGYTAGYPNALGGICNGITAGFDDENNLAFIPEQYKDRLDQNWRWGEQWIPHAAWFALAITWQSAQGGRHD